MDKVSKAARKADARKRNSGTVGKSKHDWKAEASLVGLQNTMKSGTAGVKWSRRLRGSQFRKSVGWRAGKNLLAIVRL